eukprot:9177027-Lingulodinium_polyedra.AAC.1
MDAITDGVARADAIHGHRRNLHFGKQRARVNNQHRNKQQRAKTRHWAWRRLDKNKKTVR